MTAEALLTEIEELKQFLAQHGKALDAMRGEIRVLRTERDLLKERLNKFIRKIFQARSEALAAQKDMFFNEAEALASTGPAVAEEAAEEGAAGQQDGVQVAAHRVRQARSQAARSCAAARGRPPRAARSRARVPARRRGAQGNRRGGQRAAGHHSPAGAGDPATSG